MRGVTDGENMIGLQVQLSSTVSSFKPVFQDPMETIKVCAECHDAVSGNRPQEEGVNDVNLMIASEFSFKDI